MGSAACQGSKGEHMVVLLMGLHEKPFKTVYMETYTPTFTEALFLEGQGLLQCPSASEGQKGHRTAGRCPRNTAFENLMLTRSSQAREARECSSRL